MNRTLITLTSFVIAASMIVPCSAVAAQSMASLRAQNARLKAALAIQQKLASIRLTANGVLSTQLAARTKERDTAAGERDSARAELATTKETLATRTTERDNALAGLPAAIVAVPISDFRRLVFDPARAAWPCDSFYAGTGGYWSYDFTNPSEFC